MTSWRKARTGMLAGCGGLLVLALAACSEAEAQTPTEEPSGIAVDGRGSVSVAPDIAEVELGVESRAETVAEAREEAAGAMEQVRDAVLDEGVAEEDLQTHRLSIHPERARGDGAEPEIVGYVVTNRLLAMIRDIDAVSEVVDSAVDAGGDEARVGGIRFTVEDPEQHADQARQEAVADARDRAEALAAAAGVDLGEPRFITETSTDRVPPVMPDQAAVPEADVDTATPIEPGEEEIEIAVSVVFELQ